MSAECECSEEYGPCEDHSEVLAQREGAALRTADELLAVFIGDALEIIREDGDPSVAPMLAEWKAVADAYWEACPNGGWAPLDDGTGLITLGEWLGETVITMETYLPAWVYWEDGYLISRITGGPLHADADEDNGR